MVEKLDSVTFWINPIILISQISFGIFGNLFNIIIFSRQRLRTNSCSIYFLSSSINNIFVIFIVLIPRYLLTSWNFDPWSTNNIFCKLRTFFVFSSLTLILWFIVLASIDRYLLSSRHVKYRQLSNLLIARKTIIFTIILTYFSYAHILIFYRSDIKENVMICSIFSYEYYIFFHLFISATGFILPMISMSIFVILLIMNIRSIRNRIVPYGDNIRNERLRSNDRQLIIMVLLQVLITTLISVPFAIISTYSAIAINIFQYKFSISGQVTYDFLYNICRLLYYTNSVLGFYIYTLTSVKFRAEIKYFLTNVGLVQFLSLRVQRVLSSEN